MSEEAPATPAGGDKTTDRAGGSKPQPRADPSLWLVATPIGNLEDISPRALAVLESVDRIACEDTRRTGRLLARHGISARLVAYHEHNAARVRPALIRTLVDGGSVALVSDAGTPLISDPGYKLVRAALDAGIRLTGCPGPSAPLLALILSGLPTDRFYFGGFLPSKAGSRQEALTALCSLDATLVFLESPRRLPVSLANMEAILGPRPAAVARELTKLHEEVRRGTLDELAGHYAAAGAPKGEVVIVVGGERGGTAQPALSDADIDARLDRLLAEGTVRDAVAALSAVTGLPRRELYSRALARSRAREGCAVDP